MPYPLAVWLAGVIALLFGSSALAANQSEPTLDWLRFANGTFEGWRVSGKETWQVLRNPARHVVLDDPQKHVVTSRRGRSEEAIGTMRSQVFTIKHPIQRFSLAGADGTETNTNDGDLNHLLMRSHPDGAILRQAKPPGGMKLVSMKWDSWDLIGREVTLELVDNNPKIHPKGYAWIGFADYRQEPSPALKHPVWSEDLFGLKIDAGAELTVCRSMPFWAALPEQRVTTRRISRGNAEIIPVGASAKVLYIAGMINEGWDYGLAHWGEHPELRKERNDQVHIGSRIGELVIRYADDSSDRIPIVIGTTAWFVAQWAHGPTHGHKGKVREPFSSRPDYAAVLNRSLKLRESVDVGRRDTRHLHYFLAIKPRPQTIDSIVIHDNPALRGRPLVSAITLSGAKPNEQLHAFGNRQVDEYDLPPALDSTQLGDWEADIEALADVLYTKDEDLPKQVSLIDFPENLDAAKIRFHGPVIADMLSNLWVANLSQIAVKFDRQTGKFHESGKDYPWYGGYSGIGTWAPIGVYHSGAFPRCSDHFASLALRCINDPVRNENYVDFVDKGFYFFRDNHDPTKGPPNASLAAEKYPSDAPGHWGFVVPPGGPPQQINEIPGEEEMDGHGATIVARWLVWRTMGQPTDAWLTAPRENVFGKSRWDTTREAAEFICWLMDYTGMDVMWSEGETTGWGGPHLNMVPKGMRDETDPAKIKGNYANSAMYQPYPTYVCMTALRCSADLAEAIGDDEIANRWRTYADRLQSGMLRLLVEGDHGNMTWIQSRYSVLPSLQDSLVQAWFAIYRDGLDPKRLHPQMTAITRNTLRRQLSYPYGHKPVLAMGYGMGWITKAALILDELDDAGPLLANIAKYSYDKNMDYVDEKHGIDWRKFLWLIPEGTNLLPDGRWYRIGDLTNGANQGPAMHALELCAGIDDTHPGNLKILPRVPDPLTGLEVDNFLVLVPDGKKLTRARISYQFNREKKTFSLRSDRPLPTLSIRLGPFPDGTAAIDSQESFTFPIESKQRIETSGTYNGKPAWWLWVEAIRDATSVNIGPK